MHSTPSAGECGEDRFGPIEGDEPDTSGGWVTSGQAGSWAGSDERCISRSAGEAVDAAASGRTRWQVRPVIGSSEPIALLRTLDFQRELGRDLADELPSVRHEDWVDPAEVDHEHIARAAV